MVTPMEIRSAVICNHQRDMKPKQIALKANLSRRTVAELIKKKDSG